jgi:hypothetical protein
VTWRYGGGYVGWAPLPPASARLVVETYHPYWCFVATEHFVLPDHYHHAIPVQNYHAAFSATASVTQQGTYGGSLWNSGPPPGQVSQEIGRPIHTAEVAPPPGGVPQPHQLLGHGAPGNRVQPSPPTAAETPAPAADHAGLEKSPTAAEKSAAAQREQPRHDKEPKVPAPPKSGKRKKR